MPKHQKQKKISKIKKILLKYKAILENDNFPVKDLILYGSYAKGNFKPYSDIDVCVISEKFSGNYKIKNDFENYLWKKVLDVDPRIEPIGYSKEDFKSIDPLVNEIKKYGIKIK